MGLDITYYRRLTPVSTEEQAKISGAPEPIDFAYERDLFRPYDNSCFPKHVGGVNPKWWYRAADSEGFCAGSYGGYSRWRKELARVVGIADLDAWHELPTDVPFFELIDFSDCEGTIGPVTSAELARDFAEQQNAAEIHAMNLDNQFGDGDGAWFLRKYGEWRRAFEFAADGGAVDFH